MIRTRSRLLVPATAALLVAHATASHAIDLPASLGRADTATQADLYLVPPMAFYRTDLDEAGLQRQSCHFSTIDPAAIRRLAALLQKDDVRNSPVYQRPDIREGVTLTFVDRSQLKVLIQDNHGGHVRVNGLVEASTDGDIESVAITAADTLSADLRTWADAQGGVGSGSACDRLKPPSIAPPALPLPLP